MTQLAPIHEGKHKKGGASRTSGSKKSVHFKEPVVSQRNKSKTVTSSTLEVDHDLAVNVSVQSGDEEADTNDQVHLDGQDSFQAAFHPPLPTSNAVSPMYEQHHVQMIRELEEGEFVQVVSRKQAKESRRLGLDRRRIDIESSSGGQGSKSFQ